jgi:hypothetical protein
VTRIIASVLFSAASIAAASDILWYRQEAANWNEALPIGNGRLGGMVFGSPQSDHIQLNEDTIWAGEKRDRNNPEAAKNLPEVRRLLFAGMPHEAEVLAERTIISIPKRLPPYQTMGDLRIGSADPGIISDYRRELDLSTAVVRVTYHARNRSWSKRPNSDVAEEVWDEANYTREYFSSAADQVIVVRLTCDKPHHIDIGTGLAREAAGKPGDIIDAKIRFSGADRVVLEGEAIARDPRPLPFREPHPSTIVILRVRLAAIFPHRITAHLNEVDVVNQPVQDAIRRAWHRLSVCAIARPKPNHPSRTRAFIAASLGLLAPSYASQSITFFSDTLCCVTVTNSTVTDRRDPPSRTAVPGCASARAPPRPWSSPRGLSPSARCPGHPET